MNSYFQIAQEVLRSARRPLSARTILETAYRFNLVPAHLYGTTQHKTLQARLSESILEDRERSLFFRTAPGRFFLREFLEDNSIPEKFREPIRAQRRKRSLNKSPSLALEFNDFYHKFPSAFRFVDRDLFIKYLNSGGAIYSNPRRNSEAQCFVRAYVCVIREGEILTYRHGLYREGRDEFLNKRSVGFASYVDIGKNDLFTRHDLGITYAGVSSTQIDLDMPNDSIDIDNIAELKFFVISGSSDTERSALAIIRFNCPEWFEPTSRRLAINDLQWMSLEHRVSQIDDFDPWSQDVMPFLLGGI